MKKSGCPAFSRLCSCSEYRKEDETASARCIWYKPNWIFANLIEKCPLSRKTNLSDFDDSFDCLNDFNDFVEGV